MTRREEITKIIHKWTPQSPDQLTRVPEVMVNDLLTLLPAPPSREALVKLFDGRGHNKLCRNGSETGSENQKLVEYNLGHHPSHCECRVDALMAWATGTPEPKAWCKHCVWGVADDGIGLWQHRLGYLNIPPEWSQCPICWAKRP